MKKSLGKVLITATACFAMMGNVYGAAKPSLTYVYYNDQKDGNYRIRKVIGSNSTFMDFITMKDTTDKVGYCVDVVKNLNKDISYTETQDLASYLNATLNNSTKAKNLAAKISQYAYYGYTTSGTRNTNNYYAATQKLIWEELYKNGYGSYNKDAYLRADSANIEVDVSKETNEILNAVANHLRKPSFCSSKDKLEIGVGETATFTDNNKTLSYYKVSCTSDLKCEPSGNNLKVTVLKKDGDKKITFTKDAKGTPALVYKHANSQGVLVGGKVEPVSCSFGVDTFENIQTAGPKMLAIVSIGLLFGFIAFMVYFGKENLGQQK